ncbi:MAG: GTPase Era [Lachnospiraceae bacterium]|nr:GTPase Era [Lachnospiraceae bacterium]
MSGTRSGFAAIVGRPNVGKSTLMNRLIGQKIAITSDKPQTTRNRIQTVYTDERGQIVFLDTPGLHRARTKLGDYMVDAAKGTLADADLVLWLVEPSAYIGTGDREIAAALSALQEPVIIVINKTDTLQREELLPVMAAFGELMDPAEIIPVSAKTGEGCGELLTAIFGYLKEGPLYYDEETVTDQTMRQISGELIREAALRSLRDEIPHGIAVEVNRMTQREGGLYDIEADIICERDSHKGIIIGKGGLMLRKIGTKARTQIEDMTGSPVNLRLFVKVRRDWRDNETLLRQFGYHKD